MNKPNNLFLVNYEYDEHDVLGRNQIYSKFTEALDGILTTNYNEGTKYGKWFNDYREDGTSSIYVKDELENRLDEFIKKENDEMQYLVGFTGIGKTTLLKNFFRVKGRDPYIYNNNIIMYISFYTLNTIKRSPHKTLEKEIKKYMQRMLRILWDKYDDILKLTKDKEKEFYKEFYNYIKKIKPILLETDSFTPKSGYCLDNCNVEKELNKLYKDSPFEYYSCMLKFVLASINDIENIIFIYDDIESKGSEFHKPLVEIARNIHSCFSTTEERNYYAKSIIALRAYTYRSNLDRQLEARRECVEHNTILKTAIPGLSEIFLLRFEAIEKDFKKRNVGNIDTYEEATKELVYVAKKLGLNFEKIISELTNYNIFKALFVFSKIMTNRSWFGENEIENGGVFTIDHRNYKYTVENVFKSLAYGEKDVYVDENNNILTNILHNHKKGTELLGLYIIRFCLKAGIVTLYGKEYETGKDIVRKILQVFACNAKEDLKLKENLNYMMRFLYDGGILLKSIYDIEKISDESIKREYRGKYKLYLSLRGFRLYKMLSENSLLFELYRDDIYTNLTDNDKPTNKLTQKEKLLYLIDYTGVLFSIEKDFILKAKSKYEDYFEYFGDQLIISDLLTGITNSINIYYKQRDNEYNILAKKVYLLLKNIKEYINDMKTQNNIEFCISSILEKFWLENKERFNIED